MEEDNLRRSSDEVSKTRVDIAVMNSNYMNLEKSVAALTGEVRAGNQQNVEIIKTLAVQGSQLESSKKYQDDCEVDRGNIRNEYRVFIGEVVTRLGKCENTVSGIVGRCIGWSSACTLAIALLTLYFESKK